MGDFGLPCPLREELVLNVVLRFIFGAASFTFGAASVDIWGGISGHSGDLHFPLFRAGDIALEGFGILCPLREQLLLNMMLRQETSVDIWGVISYISGGIFYIWGGISGHLGRDPWTFGAGRRPAAGGGQPPPGAS